MTEGKWSNLVYISILGKHQTKSDIGRAWDISINGGPLYQSETKEDIEDLIDNNMIEKRGSTLYADFRSKEFEDKLREYFEDRKEEEADILASYVLDNFNEFLGLIRTEEFRREVFDIETMVELCNKDTKDGKKIDMMRPFTILINAYSTLFMPKLTENIGGINEDNFSPLMRGVGAMFEGFADEIIEDSPYNLRPFIDNLEAFEEEYRELDFLMDAYTDSANEELPPMINIDL